MKVQCSNCNKYKKASPMKGVCINCYLKIREEMTKDNKKTKDKNINYK